MSGRSMKNFVTQHRTDESDKLVHRVKTGLASNKYQEVDYDQLRALAAEKKVTGQKSYSKVQKLQDASKHSKEQNILNQHKMVWHREFSRLNALRRKCQAEVDFHVKANTENGLSQHAYADFADYESAICEDFNQFKANTVEPIWNLREDLEFWLHSQDETMPEHPDKILQTVQSVKKQQQQLLQKLHNDQQTLEREIRQGDLLGFSSPQDRKIHTGIPKEAYDLACPSEELKASVLQEFIILDQRYVDRLELLEQEHIDAIRSDTGGWTEEDHFTFVYVIEQYPADIHNRRTLYIDRLKRHLPEKNRNQLVAHEDWWIQYRYYHERRRDILNDWVRDRRELLNRTKVIFSEACMEQDLDEAKAESRTQQQELCDALYTKVREWRQHKAEAMRLEQALEANRQQEYQERVAEQTARDKRHRQEQKEQIQAHHRQLLKQQQQKEQEYKERLKELNELLAEQAAYDADRVKYRERQQKKKDDEKERKRQEKLTAAAEKEERLEALREQVRPHMEWDPLRVWSETEAWQARRMEEKHANIQKPLYEVNTFTANQITADPRFRLEQRLRDAGIHNNDYARTAFTEMKPLHAPRKDMQSTLFK